MCACVCVCGVCVCNGESMSLHSDRMDDERSIVRDSVGPCGGSPTGGGDCGCVGATS